MQQKVAFREQCKVDWVAGGCWPQCRMRNQRDVAPVAKCHTLKHCNSMTKTSAPILRIMGAIKKGNLRRIFSHISIVECALTAVRSSASYVRYWAMSYHFVFRQKVLMWFCRQRAWFYFRIFRKNQQLPLVQFICALFVQITRRLGIPSIAIQIVVFSRQCCTLGRFPALRSKHFCVPRKERAHPTPQASTINSNQRRLSFH